MQESRSSIEMVMEFHKTFGHPIGDKPMIPTEDRVSFRIKMLEDEIQEGIDAIELNDLVELADALGDIQYFLDGFFIESGLQDKKHAIMTEIHRSNMSKLCKDEGECVATIKLRGENSSEVMSYAQVGNFWKVYKVSDTKIVKSINFSPPELNAIIYGIE